MMDNESNPVSTPPILSDEELALKTDPVPPPLVGEEKIVVPPILTEEEKNPPGKREKKPWKNVLYTFVVWLTKEEMVGTWTSFAFHFFLLISLATIVYHTPTSQPGLMFGGFSSFDDGLGDGDGTEITSNDDGGAANSLDELIVPTVSDTAAKPELAIVDSGNKIIDPRNRDLPGNVLPDIQAGNFTGSSGDLVQAMGSGGGFAESRGVGNRGKRGGRGDPTNESEKGVEGGLRWIAMHQDSDGGWSFDLGNCGKRQECSNPGKHHSRTAATGIALLPFLGAGYTHLEGQYRSVVERGLRFLLDSRNSIEMSRGNDLTFNTDQGMYSQGIATLALCEAYGMTRGQSKTPAAKAFEEKLRIAAQNAIRYIESAQVQQGQFVGGWRYRMGESPGDLSVGGWQMLALKSAILSGLEVKSTVLSRAELFLNSTQYDDGRRYNYLPVRFPYKKDLDTRESVGRYPDSEFTCTAIGLLLRMYLGAKPGDRALDEGMSLLDRWGGLKSETKTGRSGLGHCNLYYAYYGTLAMKHYGGSGWNRWYPELRDFLIQSQSQLGHESGSWFFPDPYCDVGGRLLNTAFAVMILEAPYRYISLYDAK